MGFAIVSVVFALIILSAIFSLEATTGFVAPLVSRTSPKHPLYNPNANRRNIIREKQRISAERELFFARKRRGLIPNQGVAPIDSDITMTYFIGTPPVETQAVPDTGSDLVWLQCQPCQKCYKQKNPIFDPKHSSSYQLVPCESPNCHEDFGFTCGSKKSGCYYVMEYVDNSTSRGVVATDTLSLPETEYSHKFTHPNTVFGCGFSNEDTYSDGSSGIVGLQNVSISLAGQIGAGNFSYCKSGHGGYFRFGSTSTLVGSSTPLSTDDFYQYQVSILKIVVAANDTYSEDLDVNADIFKVINNEPDTGVIVDSGTPYTRLNPVAFNALLRKIGKFMEGYQSYTAQGWEMCYNENENVGVSFDTMPSVHFVFGNNMIIEFPNENIWTDKDEEGNICLQIFPSTTNMTTIGSEQLSDYNIGFDLRRNLLWLDHQIGCVY